MYQYVPSTYLVCTYILAHFTGTWASLVTTLSQLFFIVIPRFCGEINEHPGSAPVAEDQYLLQCVALADRNFNVACETGIWELGPLG
jgi:hypothetical protein